MTQQAGAATILRVELWHVFLLLATALTLGQTKLIDLTAFFLGGAFMGVNFCLLGFGVLWIMGPLAEKGRVKAGVSLLILKIIIFLGLLTLLFFQFQIDGLSFALGFSSLLVAFLVEAVIHSVK